MIDTNELIILIKNSRKIIVKINDKYQSFTSYLIRTGQNMWHLIGTYVLN